MVRNTLLIVLLVGGIGYLADRGILPIDEGVIVSLTAPTTLYASAEGTQEIVVPLEVHLINKTSSPVEIEVPTPCKIFRWIVLTPDNEFVQSASELDCPQDAVTGTLQPNYRLDDQYKLTLDPRRIKPGRNYRLRYSFWGYENSHDFSVESVN